jgi:hypothetical protein
VENYFFLEALHSFHFSPSLFWSRSPENFYVMLLGSDRCHLLNGAVQLLDSAFPTGCERPVFAIIQNSPL